MTTDTRTPAEKAYDAIKDGSLYTKPESLLLAVADLVEEIDGGERTMVQVSPSLYASACCHTPILALRDNIPMVRLGGDTEEHPDNPWQRVYETVRLNRRGVVVLDAEEDVFVLTADEFAAQTGETDDLAELPMESRLFAAVVNDFLSKVDAPCRGMAKAGLILLAAAADGIGPKLEDDATEEEEEREIQARIFHAARVQGEQEGFEDGVKATLELIKEKFDRLDKTAPLNG